MQSSTSGDIFLNSYRMVNKYMKFEERRGIVSLLDKLGKGNKKIIFLAPTGYGKSSIVYTLATSAFKGTDLYDRVIHVLPLRAIVDDLYSKVVSAAKNMGFDSGEIGAKSMDFSRESDFYTKKVTITTIDSFVSTLFKMNLEEHQNSANARLTHYELARSMIFSSIVIVDEFHLFAQDIDDGDYSQLLTSAVAMLESLCNISVPVIIIGATLPNSIIKFLEEKLEFILIEGEKNEIVNVKDRQIEIRFCPDTDLEESVDRVLQSGMEEGSKLGVFVNTRKGAIALYNSLSKKSNALLLIHGKYSKEDYVKKLNQLKNRNTYDVVISTQVLEAGVDISFDQMVSENAPMHVLIQRAGRLKRYGGKGVLTICKAENEAPYFNLEAEFMDESKISQFRESINEGTLKKFDEKEIVTMLDIQKLRDLEEIDRNPYFTNVSAGKNLDIYCNFVRGVELLNGVNNEGGMIPITEREARKLICLGAKFVDENNSDLQKLNGLFNGTHVCLEPLFEKYRIKGIRVNYDEKTGIIFPWEEVE